MKHAQYYIDKHKLMPHPEGGYFRELYRSKGIIPAGSVEGYNADRNFATSIYFLLQSGNKSHFHQLKSDELWYFHIGSALRLHCICPSGEYKQIILGSEEDSIYQITIPAGTIFGAEVIQSNSFTLLSCMVAPGFDFNDFRLMNRDEMLNMFPYHKDVILQFTK